MGLSALFLTAVALGYAGPQPAEPPKIEVLVLDALSGKPVANVAVQYLCDEIPHSTDHESRTDMRGFASVPYSCTPGTAIEFDAVPQVGKEGCGGGAKATLPEIESKGVIADPSEAGGIWCPSKISRKVKPLPGRVILFVKKPTWWQSHIAG